MSQSVDIWSLGCVFSEVAVWVMYGWREVLKYRHRRRLEARLTLGMDAGHLFHDGTKILQAVTTCHLQIQKDCKHTNDITGEVVRSIIPPMLEYSELRPKARTVYDQSSQLSAKALEKVGTMSESHEYHVSQLTAMYLWLNYRPISNSFFYKAYWANWSRFRTLFVTNLRKLASCLDRF